MAEKHDHHHNEPQDSMSEVLMKHIAIGVQNFIKTPLFQNEMLGNAMRHIGVALQYTASGYAALTPEQILTTPERFDSSGDALVLTNVPVKSENAFSLLVNCTIDDSGNKNFLCNLFRADEFNTLNAQFIKLAPEMQAEVMRQLGHIVQQGGDALLCLVVVKNYFKRDNEPENATVSVGDLVTQAHVETGLPEPVALH